MPDKKHEEEYKELIAKCRENIQTLKRASEFFRDENKTKAQKLEKKPKLFKLLEKTEQIQKRLWEILIDEEIGDDNG